MSDALDVLSVGAVTSIGLDAAQVAAAFRARVAGFRKELVLEPPLEPLTGAKIPVHFSLRNDATQWLVNMAVRAIREALRSRVSLPARIGLILTLPEEHRALETLQDGSAGDLLSAIAAQIKETRFTLQMSAAQGGAGIANALLSARELLRKGAIDACVVGGMDSLVNRADVTRFLDGGRVLESGNPKGLIPGEGAAALLVSLASSSSGALARCYGMASAMEGNPVLGARLSRGRGFEAALRDAIQDSRLPESSIDFRVSTLNGEHYAVWESMFYGTRAYRTRRESFPVWYSASSMGELGAASGAIAMVLAALAIAGGYAPGPYAMCESASEAGLRGACLMGPAAGRLHPPFRPEEGAGRFVAKLTGNR